MASAMPPNSETSPSVEEDYYSILNLDKNANPQEITNSYRRLSRFYHPDKHHDVEKKEQAEILFNKTKKAHEVLSDPHKRAIYDTVGLQGLQTDGWLIVERTKTPQEIREEYEQLMKEREERRMQHQMNPKGTLVVGINATDLFNSYDIDEDDDEYGFPTVEISSMSIAQSVDATINNNTFTLSGNLTSQNGNGTGSVGCTVRKITSSKGWMEFGVGGGNGLLFNMKGFRHFTSKSYASLQGNLHFSGMGFGPSVQAVLGRQLTRHVSGYLTYNGAVHSSSMKTSVVLNTTKGHYFSTDFQLNLRGYYWSLNYHHKLSDDTKLRSSLKFGTFGAIVEYGCVKTIGQENTIAASVAVGLPSGVTLKIKLNRANQSYHFPIHLSEEIYPSAVFYGTVTPIIGWYMLKFFLINPYNERQKKKLLEENTAKLAERKKEAMIAVNLMQETYERIKELEESKRGLIIIQATYGSLITISEDYTGGSNSNCFDVTIQLQCLVKESRLVLPARSKGSLPGFYDPCLGEEKCLLVKYSYRNITHSITVKDCEILRIPNER